MAEERIVTPRGLYLQGTFIDPVDSTDAAVLFSHSFFDDRNSGGYFSRLAAAYRSLGYATFQFDYSGHGDSDDCLVLVRNQEEDLRAASGWLSDLGFSRQLLHGHSFGTLAPLKTRPPAVETMILSGVITGPLSFDWEAIFSADQLDQLERTGHTYIVDDLPNGRERFEISRQTLRDMSLNDPARLVDDLDYPVLLLHDPDDEQAGLLDMTANIFSRLPDGSRLEAVRDASFKDAGRDDLLTQACMDWARTHVPVR